MKLTIKNKLIAAFSILVVFMVAIFVISTISLSELDNRINYMANNTAKRIRLGSKIKLIRGIAFP